MLATYRTLIYAVPDQLHIGVTLNPADLGVTIGIVDGSFLNHSSPFPNGLSPPSEKCNLRNAPVTLR